MAIPDTHRSNFDTLLRAAADGSQALLECRDAVTKEPRYVLCAVERGARDYALIPFGHLQEGNPFEAYLPPGELG